MMNDGERLLRDFVDLAFQRTHETRLLVYIHCNLSSDGEHTHIS